MCLGVGGGGGWGCNWELGAGREREGGDSLKKLGIPGKPNY